MDRAIVLLKTGETLISAIEQLEYEPKVHLVCPHTISGKTKVVLSQWPAHTRDEHVLLDSSTLLTVCEPTDKIVEAYDKKVGKRVEELSATPEPVVLNEETIPDEDDYEPRYVEDALY